MVCLRLCIQQLTLLYSASADIVAPKHRTAAFSLQLSLLSISFAVLTPVSTHLPRLLLCAIVGAAPVVAVMYVAAIVRPPCLLPHSRLHAPIGCSICLWLLRETLAKPLRKPFSWRAANPFPTVCLLAQNKLFTLLTGVVIFQVKGCTHAVHSRLQAHIRGCGAGS